mgnify:CR=1 FL=1|tara:strand:- start:8069 stop:8641 length:573 start_codon:yes stop_codon:yes gene_type:complete
MAQQAKIEDYSGTEVISLAEAKTYIRVDHSDDDFYIADLIKIARMQVLKDTNTAVVDLDVTEYFDKWPNDGIFQLRYSGKLGNTINVKYYDSSNTLTTLVEDTDYRRIDYMGMPKIEMINTFTLRDRLNAIEIGYSVEPENSDETRTLKIAMYMLIQHYYDNRSPVSYLKVDEMPLGYKNIINQYKNYIW